ncbi:hypothetical protein NESM_000142500 [Novymonas esmeraldas]|uniref:Uncharacterized protein n=1 Tax=Novymonas esmeraldas TaxID=1808958 RepID=A0AAW0F6A6_9TRYP
MSLFTSRGRIAVSDSELDSVASSSTADSADALVEELARMSLAGHYGGEPHVYETSQLLRGRGLARRLREPTPARPSTTAPPRRAPSLGRGTSARSPALTAARAGASRRPALEVEEADREARALEKMYRHLAREYLRGPPTLGPGRGATNTSAAAGAGGADRETEASTQGSASASPSVAVPTRKPRRKPDELARSRILTPSKVQLERRVEKYERRKEREEEARKQVRRVRVPAEAVKRGTRLFLEARERANNVREMQETQARLAAAEETKECTFRPSLSKYAVRLAESGPYTPPELRLGNHAMLDESRQRLRLERAVELEKECTFHPTLSPRTEELVATLRRRRPSSSSGASQPSRGRRASVPPPAREPFEPGERLYRDGGERLLRRQVRLQRETARDHRHVVGGALRLTRADAAQLADRFAAWAATRDVHREELRAAVEREEREALPWRRPTPCVSDPVSRHGSDLRSGDAPRPSTAAPPSQPQVNAAALSASRPPCDGGGVARVTGSRSVSSQRAASSRSPSRSGAGSSSGGGTAAAAAAACAAAATVSSYVSPSLSPSASVSSPPLPSRHAATPVMDASVHKELLRIRLGALFYKYAVSPTSATVCLAQVRHQVRRYYPEDAGVDVALAACVADEQQQITKTGFMAALARYVATHGIQPWSLPHQHGATTAAVAPHCCSTSSTETAAASHDVVHSGTASANSPARSLSSSDSLGSGRHRSVGVRHGTAAAVCTPAAARTSSAAAEERSARTHIYTAQEREAGGVAAAAEPAVVVAAAAAAASQGRAASTRGGGRAQRVAKRTGTAVRPSAPAESPGGAAAAAAVRVRGYDHHVQRQRRATGGAQSAAHAVQGAAEDEEECTFRPALNPRSVVLSDRDLARRIAYAQELQVRRHELDVLRVAVLAKEAGPSLRGSTQTQPPPPPPPPTPPGKRHSASLSGGTSPPSGLSPSIELSSLSCTTPLHGSGSASSRPTASPSPPRGVRLGGDQSAQRRRRSDTVPSQRTLSAMLQAPPPLPPPLKDAAAV